VASSALSVGPILGIMPRWEVPYESPARTAVRFGFASMATLWTLFLVAGLPLSDPSSLSSWIFGIVLAAFFITAAWRIVLVGVWIGDHGIKVNMVARTCVVRWSKFDRVWLAPATGYDALALWISTTDGRDIETPLWRVGTRVWHRNRTKLSQQELSRLMERLRIEARLDSPS
jgi:hypothetical protein